MKNWQPNPHDAVPLYRQVAAHCKGLIASGQWPAGFRLPAQRALALQFGINRSTLAIALAELSADGLLSGRVGSGTYVANDSWALLKNPPPPDWQHYASSAVHHANHPTIQQINRHEFQSGIIRLGTGELAPDLQPRAEMSRCLEKISQQLPPLGYEEPQGLFVLREAISQRLATQGINASPASILIVSGALQAFQLISLGLLPPGADIFLEQPSYLFSLTLFRSQFTRLTGLAMDNDGLLPAALTHQQTKHPASLLYTIPCFHNPTGITMSAPRRQEIASLCRRYRLPILEDDVYRDLWLDEPPPLPLKAADVGGSVLYLGSLSKTLSPGLRIGWLVGPEPVIERLADVKMQFDYGASSLSQWAAHYWLRGDVYERHLAALRGQLALRRTAALNALTRYFSEIAEWHTPSGGFYIWLTLHQPLSLSRLFHAALNEGILLNPGFLYDACANRQLRLSYSYASVQELEDALKKLALLIQNLSGK